MTCGKVGGGKGKDRKAGFRQDPPGDGKPDCPSGQRPCDPGCGIGQPSQWCDHEQVGRWVDEGDKLPGSRRALGRAFGRQVIDQLRRTVRHEPPGAPEGQEIAAAKQRVPLEAVRAAVAGLLDHPRAGEIDTLVLACTHFPLLADELAAAFGPQVAQIDGAAGIAGRIAHLLSGQDFASAGPNRFVITGPASGAEGLAPALTARGFGAAEVF